MASSLSQRAYPPAERLDLVEELHGHRVADPYRWLEDPADPRTERWAAAQDEMATAALAALPERAVFHERLTGLLSAGVVGTPVWRGRRAFLTRREPGQEHAALVVVDAGADAGADAGQEAAGRADTALPPGAGRVLVDTARMDPSGLTTLDTWSVSVEGDRLAYQISVGGDEESMLYVLDVATGAVLEGPIDRLRYTSVAWLPGGEEFFYARRLDPASLPAGEENLHRRVYRHRVGADPATDQLVWGEGMDPTTFFDVSVSRDGRWLVVSARQGTAPRDDVWVADLHGDAVPREVQVGVDAQVRAWVARDGLLYLLTDRDAPRGRLLATDPAAPAYENWRVVVPESPDGVLVDVALPSARDGGGVDAVLAAHTRDATAELSWWDPATAARRGVVPGIAAGKVTGLSARSDGGPVCWVGYTDFRTPAMVLRWSLDEPERVTAWATAPGAPDCADVRVSEVHYPSADGTSIHMFLLAAEEISGTDRPAGPRPTILYGYGGFNIPQSPDYNPIALAWVRAGGVYAIANLRGGSEHGEEWHRAGRRERKQNVFDDFHAAARWLIDRGVTTTERLAIYGGSNGGLLVGAALTQWPQTFSAVLCSKPLLDMVRYERHGLGRLWSDEYGSADRPDELPWLLGYSPYHRVRQGVSYPAVLFTTFEADSRVDPLHARKMCAALQHVSDGTRPVLLRRELGVGHATRSVSRSAALMADQLAFVARELAT